MKTIHGGFTEKTLKELRDSNITMVCSRCKEEKHNKSFTAYTSKFTKLKYLSSVCNNCHYKHKLIAYKDGLAGYCAKQRHKEIYTINGRASLLRNRCKQRAKRYKHEFNLSIDLVIEKLKNGICEATGIPFEIKHLDFHPYSPSIDRIDSSKGYTDDNIQLVCMIYNLCKNQFSDYIVKDFFKKVIHHENNFKIFIPGSVTSSKNSKIWTGKHLVWSKASQKYKKDTEKSWKEYKEAFIAEASKHEKPYKISIKFIRGNRHKFDYINMCQTIFDLMVEYKWIIDDNADEVLPFFEKYEYDKDNPGVIIKIL